MQLFIVDAFAEQPFEGNQAAVCLLDSEVDAQWMQQLAVEINYSETAFVAPRDDGYHLRWFTPGEEVELCGHATLATAHVLWQHVLDEPSTDQASEILNFDTLSGRLTARRSDDQIQLDFPATQATAVQPPEGLLDILGIEQAVWVGQSRFDLLVEVGTESELRALQPDFRRLADQEVRGVMVTSTSSDPQFDFVSRFFAPRCGVDEDPVTGSAHCCLGPYWSKKLGKTEMVGFQASPRGGQVRVDVQGERVGLAGRAITILQGNLSAEATAGARALLAR